MTRRALAPALALALALMLHGACPDRSAERGRGRRSPTSAPSGSARPAPPRKEARLKLGWNPTTGKGDVQQILASGDILRACFHCAYPGYTGGLVIGNYNGSGYGLYPKRPIRGHRRINVFCAQDESIWDRREKVEYSYGWSENYGKGADGKRLTYRRGRVIDGGPQRIVLQSENVGGCYAVSKVAYTRAGVRWWIIATRVRNRCAKPVHFDFFSGDDPWIGLYRSSDGDVGWTPAGLVRRERALVSGRFTVGGLYDLGNRALGQKEGSFSNQANFIALDPAVPLPDLAIFANGFAHRAGEIDSGRALDNKSPTALNLGWTDQRLSPGEGLTVAMALGLARTGRPGAVPAAPQIADADWSVWRRYLVEGNPAAPSTAVEFAAERVEIDLAPRRMRVTGHYVLRNRGGAATSVGIHYPILIAAARPAPATVRVDGRQHPVQRENARLAAARFPVSVAARSMARFCVSYTQQHRGRRAVYMVTSARRWPTPITRAVFVIRHPASMGRVKVSYPVSHRSQRGGEVELLVTRRDFVPDRELAIRWKRGVAGP